MELECNYPEPPTSPPGVVSLRRRSSASVHSASSSCDLAVGSLSTASDVDFHRLNPRSTTSTPSVRSLSISPGSPLLKNVSILSLIPSGEITIDLGSQMRLYHHFTTVIIPKLEQRSPFLDDASTFWKLEIPTMAFGSDSLLHALLALAAKDLEFRSGSATEKAQAAHMRLLHEGKALHSVTAELYDKSMTVPTVLGVLLIIWLSLITDRHETATKHFRGLGILLDTLPQELFSSDLGKEIARMFIALDITRATLRSASNRPLLTTTTWISERLRLANHASELPTMDDLKYELLSILSRFPGVQMTFLECAGRLRPISASNLDTLQSMVPALQAWRKKTRFLAEFEVTHYRSPGWPDLGSLVYASSGAAVLMAYYFMCVIRLRTESCIFSPESPCEGKASAVLRQIANGAMQLHPSTYSSQLIDIQSALNIFRPLFSCNDPLDDKFYRDWEDKIFEMANLQSSPTILNLNSPWFFNVRRLMDDACRDHLGVDRHCRMTSKMWRPGMKDDFHMQDYYVPEDTDGRAKPAAYYCFYYSGGGAIPKVIVLNQFIEPGMPPVLEPDWETSNHWNARLEAHARDAQVQDDPISIEIGDAMETIMKEELQELETCHAATMQTETTLTTVDDFMTTEM